MAEGLQRLRLRRGCLFVLTAALVTAAFSFSNARLRPCARPVTRIRSKPVAAKLRGSAAPKFIPAGHQAKHGMPAAKVAIISGNINGTYLAIAYDLSAALDDGDEFQHPADHRQGRRAEPARRPVSQRGRSRHHPGDPPQYVPTKPRSSARSTRPSPTSPSSLTRRCISSSARTSASPQLRSRRQKGQFQRRRQRHAALRARRIPVGSASSRSR